MVGVPAGSSPGSVRKPLTVAGLAMLAAGIALALARTRPTAASRRRPAPPSPLAAIGDGAHLHPGLDCPRRRQAEEAGLAAGIVNTSYQVGSALGLAAMTAVATSEPERLHPRRFNDGYYAAFLSAAAIAATAAVVALVLIRREAKSGAPAASEIPVSAIGAEA